MHVRAFSAGQALRPARQSLTTGRPRAARLSIRAAVKVGQKAPDFELKDEARWPRSALCLLALACADLQHVLPMLA